jgi:hypothetical protein
MVTTTTTTRMVVMLMLMLMLMTTTITTTNVTMMTVMIGQVTCKRVSLKGVCEPEPDGLLANLVAFRVPSFVFGLQPVQVRQ